jgi:hypothetical protein
VQRTPPEDGSLDVTQGLQEALMRAAEERDA